MADKLTKTRRSWNMSKIRSKDMKPERAVRSLVHTMGYRFRLHRKDLPGKPDLVFPSRRKVIFVHGCFWHQHGDPDCRDGRPPKSNDSYWSKKLARNIERDKDAIKALQEAGWGTMVVWECETRDVATLRDRVSSFLA